MTKVYITRHGQTQWNIKGIMQGQKDSPLTDKGRMQASWLSERVQELDIQHMYSSSSGRAYETAELVKGKSTYPLLKSDDLREMYLGAWEGHTFEENKVTHPEQFYNFWHAPHRFEPHDCETFEQLKDRVIGFIETKVKEHEGDSILIVTHALVLKTILNHYKNHPLKELFAGKFAHSASLTLIEFDANRCYVKMESDITHYKEETP